MFIVYFCYVALLPPFFYDRPRLHSQPFFLACIIFGMEIGLAHAERVRFSATISMIRDWLPILLTLVAFQEMEFFLPSRFEHRFEEAWIRQDIVLLHTWRLHQIIESLGSILPVYLELCYLLVYGLGPFCIGLLYAQGERDTVDRFLTIYLAGTLGAYALFPFFPSQPPRLLYPGVQMPGITTWVRNLNLFVLRKGTIHVGVFPSAHVSSAFSAAWAMFFVLPGRRKVAGAMVLYAISVSLATVYGRYHYAADVLAGIGVSVVTAIICLWFLRRTNRRRAKAEQPFLSRHLKGLH